MIGYCLKQRSSAEHMLWLACLAHKRLVTAQLPSAVVLEGPLLGPTFP